MGDDPNQQGLSRKHIMHAIDDSLRRLQTDYVDLYQIHRFDPHTPIEETLEALDQVVRAGKALYIGASSMYAWQFLKMLQTSDLMGLARFVTMQNHYNLVYREEEREMIPLCLEEGVGLIPWSPLARGFLSGNRNAESRGETVRAKTDDFAQKLYYRPSDFVVVDRLTEVDGASADPQIALSSNCPNLGFPHRSSAPARWSTWIRRSRRLESTSMRQRLRRWRSLMSRIRF